MQLNYSEAMKIVYSYSDDYHSNNTNTPYYQMFVDLVRANFFEKFECLNLLAKRADDILSLHPAMRQTQTTMGWRSSEFMLLQFADADPNDEACLLRMNLDDLYLICSVAYFVDSKMAFDSKNVDFAIQSAADFGLHLGTCGYFAEEKKHKNNLQTAYKELNNETIEKEKLKKELKPFRDNKKGQYSDKGIVALAGKLIKENPSDSAKQLWLKTIKKLKALNFENVVAPDSVAMTVSADGREYTIKHEARVSKNGDVVDCIQSFPCDAFGAVEEAESRGVVESSFHRIINKAKGSI